MTIDELGRVQVYLVTYISMAMLITFWIFPGLVAAVSGIAYREVLHTFKDALVTAFATGNQFVVLPLIAENCKTLLAKQGLAEEDTASAIDVIVPVSFNFPSLGKMLVLLFVLFAAWFTNRDLSAMQYIELAFSGLFSLFGSINVAVPYLLDKMQVPTDMFQLFLMTGVVVGRFGAMLAALHIIVLSVIGTLAVCGRLQITGPSIIRYLGISTLSVALLLGGLRAYFEMFVPTPPQRSEVLENIEQRAHATGGQVRDSLMPDVTPADRGDRIQHIQRRGELRVGYRPKNLPCTYLGQQGQVIGFDADMAHNLAQDLGVRLVFAPFQFDTLGQQLSSGQLDIAMSCIASLPDRNLSSAYSRAYLDLRLSLVVPDHMRTVFSDVQAVRKLEDFSIALVSSHYFVPRIKQILPNARIVELESAESFFSSGEPPADALLLSAEEGAAYAYRYPAFTVINPVDPPVYYPAAYALPPAESEWRDLIGNWIDLKTKDGSIDSLYDYWMLGGVTREKPPRWSVIRDVLGWID
jgi:ABC-type amino acid transport substrate-binding protein